MGLADTKLIQESTPKRPIAGADDSTSSALVVRGLRKGYGRQPVLWDLDFTLGWSECVALFGANGAGKTTLLKVASTQARADAGTVRVAQHDVRTHTTTAARHIGLVSHRHMLYEDMTGTENLRFYGRMFGLNDLHQRIAEVLGILRMEHRGQQRVRNLSNGQQKRLAIARAILHSPSLLLLDEPESGLDAEGVELLERLVRQWTADGKSVLLTTHNLERGLGLGRPGCGAVSRRHRLRQSQGSTRPLRIPPRIPSHLGSGVMTSTLKPVLALAAKDILLEARTKDVLLSVVVFGVVVLVVFNFALDITPALSSRLAPGVLWVAFAFSGVLAMNRAFAAEKERGSLEGAAALPCQWRSALLRQNARHSRLHAGSAGCAATRLWHHVQLRRVYPRTGPQHRSGYSRLRHRRHSLRRHRRSDPVAGDHVAHAVLPHRCPSPHSSCGDHHRRHQRRGNPFFRRLVPASGHI